eukprot:Skav222424  [mRNA]  locus=scaffold2890:211357:226840:- [translate_table: standard]
MCTRAALQSCLANMPDEVVQEAPWVWLYALVLERFWHPKSQTCQELLRRAKNLLREEAKEKTAASVLQPKFSVRFVSEVLGTGAEKEGIDADLLPLLDGCVEIPQQGQLRSLNVWHSVGGFFSHRGPPRWLVHCYTDG